MIADNTSLFYFAETIIVHCVRLLRGLRIGKVNTCVSFEKLGYNRSRRRRVRTFLVRKLTGGGKEGRYWLLLSSLKNIRRRNAEFKGSYGGRIKINAIATR